MSLLLEALKKAEKAKEEAQRRARSELGAPPQELRLESEPAAPAPQGKQVVMRDDLPDISQPLEIRAEDISPKAHPTLEPTLAPLAAPTAEPKKPAQKPAAAQKPAEPKSDERAAAKKVFEAKFKEPNPRLPFYFVMGALGVFAVGTVGYFWYQLRPPPAMVSTTPASGSVQPAAIAGVQPPGAGAAAPAETSSAQSIPGLPGGAAPGTPAAAPSTPSSTPAAAPSVPRAAEQAQPAVRAAPKPAATQQPVSAPERGPDLTISRPVPQVHPKVDAGYTAYLAGNFADARTEYQQVLRDDPASRDALLGLAAVEVRAGSLESAEAIYLRLLQADPRDAHAQAGLIALRGSRMDPLVAESRVKTLLAADPNAYVLNFTLGNQLAQQGRWAEAQQQYFKAFAAEPENADFAYNLAVSMDHMRQPKLALEYYGRALALAATRGASFDATAVRERVAQLAR